MMTFNQAHQTDMKIAQVCGDTYSTWIQLIWETNHQDLYAHNDPQGYVSLMTNVVTITAQVLREHSDIN